MGCRRVQTVPGSRVWRSSARRTVQQVTTQPGAYLLCSRSVPGSLALSPPPLTCGCAGHHLEAGLLYGCCPACVRYLEYGAACPGVFWRSGDTGEVEEVAVMYGGDTAASLEQWPDTLIG